MSNTSANSNVAKTSKKEVKSKLNESIRVVGGPLQVLVNEKGKYYMDINPEHIVDFTTPMMDLSKSVGVYSKVVDENGKIVKRVDEKTGVEYVLDNNSIVKATNKKSKTSNKAKADKTTVVAIDDKSVRKALKEVRGNNSVRATKSERGE